MRPLPLVLAAVLALACGAPAAGAAAPPPVSTTKTPAGELRELTLANGLKVLLLENHAAPVVTWIVFYRVGSRNEPAGATGSAHLLEHMLFKGTKTLGKGQIAQVLDRNGADFNASTWEDYTNYYETYSADRLDLGLEVEAARMRGALILDAERRPEMTVVRNEMERGESDPEVLLWEGVQTAAYRAHPYHHPVIGWRSDVEGVSSDQLRSFYGRHYGPNNAVAVLVGDFRTPAALDAIRRHFEGIPPVAKPPAMYTVEEPQVGERRVILRRRGETNLVQLAYHVPAARDADSAPLSLLARLLGKGVSSRLHQALVEPELATAVWVDAGQQIDPSLFRVGLTVAPGVPHDKAEAAASAVIAALATAPIPAEELEKARTLTLADSLFESEGTEGMAWALGVAALLDRWQLHFDRLDALRRVSSADLQRVAARYLTPDNRTVGWYAATPDGPVPPAPVNAGGGKAVASKGQVAPHAAFPFERAKAAPHALIAPKRRVLPNGLTVVVLENPASPTVTVSGFVKAGDFLTSERKRGLAGLTAEMLARGTRTRDKLTFSRALESQATTLSFAGGVEDTTLSGRMLASHAGDGFAALAEMLREPSFTEAEFEKARHEAIAALQQSQDDPAQAADRALSQAIFPHGHAYRKLDPTDAIKSIGALTRDDVAGFHHRYFGPNATTLVVVGQVKAETVFQQVARAFDGWAPVPHVTTAQIPTVGAGPAGRRAIAMPDKTNLYVLLGEAGAVKRTDPHYFASRLATYILGGGAFTSRLGMRLRDELGLTYGTEASFAATQGAGPWQVSITINPANRDIALKEMRQVIGRALAGGFTASELTDAKNSFIGYQAVRLATNEGMAKSLADIERFGLGADYWSRYTGIVQAVTLAETNAAARRMIQPGKLQLIEVGPTK